MRLQELPWEVLKSHVASRLVKIFQLTGLDAVLTINQHLDAAARESQIDGHGDATA